MEVGDGVLLTGSSTPLVGALSTYTITAFFKPDSNFASSDRFIYDESSRPDADKRPALLFRLTSPTDMTGRGNLQFAMSPSGGFATVTGVSTRS